jgi:hypothetical protein
LWVACKTVLLTNIFWFLNFELDWHSFSDSKLFVGFFVLLKFSTTSHRFMHSKIRDFNLHELSGFEMHSTVFFQYNGISLGDWCIVWLYFSFVYLKTVLEAKIIVLQMIFWVHKNNLKLSLVNKSCSILSKLFWLPEKSRVTIFPLYLLCRSFLLCYHCNYITWTAFPIFTCDIALCRSDMMNEINISLKLFAFLLDDRIILSDWAACFNMNYDFFFFCKIFNQNENIYLYIYIYVCN